jgi:hypothetical protein
LTLTRGQTYVFQLNAADAAAHPFFISTTTGIEPPTPFVNPGLSGNGTATVTFTVPTGPTVPLFYQCGVHSFMTNSLNLVSTPVPALGSVTVGVLALLVVLAAMFALRRSRRPAVTS